MDSLVIHIKGKYKENFKFQNSESLNLTCVRQNFIIITYLSHLTSLQNLNGIHHSHINCSDGLTLNDLCSLSGLQVLKAPNPLCIYSGRWCPNFNVCNYRIYIIIVYQLKNIQQ